MLSGSDTKLVEQDVVQLLLVGTPLIDLCLVVNGCVGLFACLHFQQVGDAIACSKIVPRSPIDGHCLCSVVELIEHFGTLVDGHGQFVGSFIQLCIVIVCACREKETQQ